MEGAGGGREARYALHAEVECGDWRRVDRRPARVDEGGRTASNAASSDAHCGVERDVRVGVGGWWSTEGVARGVPLVDGCVGAGEQGWVEDCGFEVVVVFKVAVGVDATPRRTAMRCRRAIKEDGPGEDMVWRVRLAG